MKIHQQVFQFLFVSSSGGFQLQPFSVVCLEPSFCQAGVLTSLPLLNHFFESHIFVIQHMMQQNKYQPVKSHFLVIQPMP